MGHGRSGDEHRLRRELQRRDGLGHQRRALQRHGRRRLQRLPTTVSTGRRSRVRRDRRPPHTLFVVNSGDDTLSAINTDRCTGAHTAGCPKLAPAQQAGSNQGPGYAQFPTQFALMPRNGSAYLVNVGGSDVMAVVDVSGCDAVNTSACRDDAPSVSHEHGVPRRDRPGDQHDLCQQHHGASRSTCSTARPVGQSTCPACAPVAEDPDRRAARRRGRDRRPDPHAVRVRRARRSR